MSSNELRQAVISGDELTFSLHGRDYLLYGWEQCDGYVLNLECDGELIWQSIPQNREICAEELLEFYSEL